MAQRTHLGIAGLVTDPNNAAGTPEGALSQADECVIRRVGSIEPRPGFAEGDSWNAVETGLIENVFGMFSYQDSVIAVGATDDPSVATIHKHEGTDYAILTEDDANLSWNGDALRAVEVRGNLYMATTDWPRKLSAVGATQVAYGVGVLPPVLISAITAATTGDGVLQDDEAVSYRMVTKRRDTQGVITYSAPSGRVIVRNTSGGARDVTLTQYVRNGIAWDEDTQTGDKLQIYRTETVAVNVDPGDDHYLIVEIPFEGVSGQGTFTDTIEEARLGAPLYTNDDQEGAEASNWRPPACKDLALYQGSLFYANQTDYARITFSVYEHQALSGQTAGVGLRTATVTYTNGSAVISDFSATEIAGIEPGMMVWNAAANMDFDDHPDPILVTDVDTGAGEITVSSPWNGSTGSAGIFIVDVLAIDVDGEPEPFYYNAGAGGAGYLIDAINSGMTDPFSGTVYSAASGLVATVLGITEDYTNATQSVGLRTIVVEALSTATTFHITGTHPGDYIPALGVITDGGTECNATSYPNRIGWSKANEPEHYLLSSFTDIGNSTPILRALATRDALWMLKGRGDGIYRLSGFGANSGFRVDQVDSSTYLLHANLACVLDDQVFAWTNRGLVSISDSGVIPLSAPVIGSDTRELETLLDHTFSFPGAWAVANPKAGEVIFGLPPTPLEPGSAASAVNYVYNTRTRAFTKWFASTATTPWLADGGVGCAVYHMHTRELWIGQPATSRPRVERRSADIVNADDEHSITITGLSGSSAAAVEIEMTIAGGSSWDPAEGDLVVKGSEYAIVLAVTSPTVVTIARTPDFTSTGAATAYTSYESRIAWRPKAIDAPGITKRFQEVTSHWASWFGVYGWTLAFALGNATSEVVHEYERSEYVRSTARTDDHRALVPRDMHHATQLRLGVGVQQADSRWRLDGLTLTFEPTSTRVSR